MPSCTWKKKIGLFVLIHINLPYIFNLMSLSFIFPSFFGFMYITLCLHCYDHNVYSFIFVNGLAVESVTDPYELLCTTFPVRVAQIWKNKGC